MLVPVIFPPHSTLGRQRCSSSSFPIYILPSSSRILRTRKGNKKSREESSSSVPINIARPETPDGGNARSIVCIQSTRTLPTVPKRRRRGEVMLAETRTLSLARANKMVYGGRKDRTHEEELAMEQRCMLSRHRSIGS